MCIAFRFKLWSTQGGNCLGSYTSLDAALYVAAQYDVVKDLFIEVWGMGDEPIDSIEGDQLLDWISKALNN